MARSSLWAAALSDLSTKSKYIRPRSASSTKVAPWAAIAIRAAFGGRDVSEIARVDPRLGERGQLDVQRVAHQLGCQRWPVAK
jgi:hypothetical protein